LIYNLIKASPYFSQATPTRWWKATDYRMAT